MSGGGGGLPSAARGNVPTGDWVPVGGAGGDASARGLRRVHRAAGMGQGERLPVGCADLCARRSGRAPGGAAVGAGEQLPVGYDDERLGRLSWAS